MKVIIGMIDMTGVGVNRKVCVWGGGVISGPVCLRFEGGGSLEVDRNVWGSFRS